MARQMVFLCNAMQKKKVEGYSATTIKDMMWGTQIHEVQRTWLLSHNQSACRSFVKLTCCYSHLDQQQREAEM
jgi:hypothetical protein